MSTKPKKPEERKGRTSEADKQAGQEDDDFEDGEEYGDVEEEDDEEEASEDDDEGLMAVESEVSTISESSDFLQW